MISDGERGRFDFGCVQICEFHVVHCKPVPLSVSFHVHKFCGEEIFVRKTEGELHVYPG